MALTYEQAMVAAREFLRIEPLNYPGYAYAETLGKPIGDSWYFDYRIVRVDDNAREEQFAGAPGFLVSSDGNIRIVGWQEYRESIRPQL